MSPSRSELDPSNLSAWLSAEDIEVLDFVIHHDLAGLKAIQHGEWMRLTNVFKAVMMRLQWEAMHKGKGYEGLDHTASA